jgi:hypothetical protein
VVLVDNNPYKHGLETAWGLSLYVEVDETCFLLDAGPNPRVLGVNAVRLGVDLSRVGFAVLTAPRYLWRGVLHPLGLPSSFRAPHGCCIMFQAPPPAPGRCGLIAC